MPGQVQIQPQHRRQLRQPLQRLGILSRVEVMHHVPHLHSPFFFFFVCFLSLGEHSKWSLQQALTWVPCLQFAQLMVVVLVPLILA